MIGEVLADVWRRVEIEKMGRPGGKDFRLVFTQRNEDGIVVDKQTLSGDIALSILDTIPHWTGRPRALTACLLEGREAR